MGVAAGCAFSLGVIPPLLPPPLQPNPPPPPPAPPSAPPPGPPSPPSRWDPPRFSAREIPVGLAYVENQVLNSRRYVYAIRFVLDRDTRLYRFLSGFNVEGSRPVGGRRGYAGGTGGRIQARLVRVKSNGEPDMRRVLAKETVGAVRRHRESRAAYGIGKERTHLLYFNMRGVKLRAGRTYAMTYRNVSRAPGRNWFSTDSPTVRASEAGPNGLNTLDRDARGAIAGLNPREAVAWSTSNGKSWVWGRRVGEGFTRGSYPGSRSGDGGVRLPWYGWQASKRGRPRSNQPYYAYGEQGAFTLVARQAPRAVTLTEAGGYAPLGWSVGVVTVANLRTGVSGRTRHLGRGIATGSLNVPVAIAPGDSYTVSNTGTVFKAEGDQFVRNVFHVGMSAQLDQLGRDPAWPFETVGHDQDRAELFALPHPYYRVTR